MKFPLRLALGCGSMLVLACLGTAPAQDPVDNDIPDGVEIQTRGPVHEAFAQPTDIRVGPGQIVPKEPPAPIPEEPPPERPEGANVQFIPGYWAWDPEDSKFLWVSGGYRNVPVGRQWVPGSWVRADGGWRWVPGMWAAEQQEELNYTPEPPAPLEDEPTMEAPSDDSTWVAGNWVYRDTRFVWRPGYWSPYRYGRVWAPARYTWTPYGYLYCDGYWDYPWENRGLLFAPISFYRPVYLTYGWYWRPSFVVNFGLFYDSCFYYPGSFHYYFGNYYGPCYAGYGYRPWYHGHGRYDPLFGYYGWRHGYGRNWYHTQQRLYADRFAGRAVAPPRTFAQQQALVVANKTTINNVNNVQAVAPLRQAKVVNQNVNLVRLTPAQTDAQRAQIKRSREIAATRGQAVGAKVSGVTAKAPGSANLGALKLPAPVAASHAIPKVDHAIPKIDTGAVAPKKGPASVPLNKGPAASSDAGTNNVTKPAIVHPSVGVSDKGTAPKIDNTRDFPPRRTDAPAPPKIVNPPQVPRPRSIETPRTPEIKQPSAPKAAHPTPSRAVHSTPPKARSVDAPAGRNADAPRTAAPARRSIEAPRAPSAAPRTVGTPRSAPAAPRVAAPQPGPRHAAPQSVGTPRSAPATPRVSAPASGSRHAAPSTTPRSAGKRGQGRKE